MKMIIIKYYGKGLTRLNIKKKIIYIVFRKIQNLESQTKDLTQYLRKAYLFRLDLLNSEKNKYELYGKVF